MSTAQLNNAIDSKGDIFLVVLCSMAMEIQLSYVLSLSGTGHTNAVI